MSTGFYSKMMNTDLSGNDLQSYLTGPNVRLLEFDAACGAPQAALSVASGGSTLNVEQWLQSAISAQLLDNATAATSCYIALGSDTASQAASYVSLFNLKSTNETRILHFIQSSAVSSGSTCSLKNLSGTSNYVKVATDGTQTTSASSSLFVQINAINSSNNFIGNLAGAERLVLLSASNIDSGSQAVTFNVLSGSL